MAFPFDRALQLRPGNPLRALRADDVTTVFRILRNLEGVGCYIEKDAQGYAWRIIVTQEPVVLPWDIVGYVPSTKTLTLRTGYVEMHDDAGTQYVAPDPLTVTLDTGDNYVYLETTADNAGVIATSLAAANALPQSDGSTYRKLLWMLTVEAGGQITASTRYAAQNVEMVGWRIREAP
jgi:hypothetical protein